MSATKPSKKEAKKKEEEKPPERKLVDTLEFKEIPGRKYLIHSGKNENKWEGYFVSIEGKEGETFFIDEELARKNIDL